MLMLYLGTRKDRDSEIMGSDRSKVSLHFNGYIIIIRLKTSAADSMIDIPRPRVAEALCLP